MANGNIFLDGLYRIVNASKDIKDKAKAYLLEIIGPITSTGGLTDAPSDGTEYLRKDAAWVNPTAGAGDMLASTYDPTSVAGDAFDYTNFTNTPTIPTSVDDLGPSQTGNSGKFLSTDGTNAFWETVTGGSSITNFSTYQDLVDDTTVTEGNFGTVTGMSSAIFLKLSSWFAITKAFVFGVTANTKAWYQMESNANDSSGNAYNGTATDVSYVTGKVGNAGSFNGTSSRINMPDAVIIGGNTTQTISVWIKLGNNTQANKTIIEFLENTTKVSIIIGYNNGVVQFRRIRQNIADNTFTYPLTDTTNWHHIVYIYNSGEGKVYGYLDGIAVGSITSSGSGSGTQPVRSDIGNSEGGSSYFNGYIDEVIIENRAWTTDMILDYYKLTK